MSENTPHKNTLRKLQSIEGELETRIKQLYLNCLGHELSLVSCTFLNSLELYILMDGTQSAAESFLDEQGNSELALKMRNTIHQVMKARLESTLKNNLSLPTNHISLLKPLRAEQLSLLVSFSF